MALTTLLFDLDGTLLPLDLDAFMKAYFEELTPLVSHLIAPADFVRHVWSSTEDMIRNEDPAVTNIQAFLDSFLMATRSEEATFWPIFEAFYANGFKKLRRLTQPTAISREICRTSLDKGYQVVIATNPIFPAEAIHERMSWAGIDDLPITFVTTMEEMHYCKPSPKYFIEILEHVDATPLDCMMFGNDVQEDGVAGKIGMQTYLVTDYLIDRGVGHLEFTHQGRLEDVLTFVNELPALHG